MASRFFFQSGSVLPCTTQKAAHDSPGVVALKTQTSKVFLQSFPLRQRSQATPPPIFAPMDDLIEIAKQQPVRSIIGGSIVYLGNPIVFFLYMFTMMNNESEQDGKKILGITSIKRLGDNVSWLNPALYVLITFPLFVFWIWLQVTLLTRACSTKCTFDAEIFYNHYVSIVSCLWAIPGLLNMYVWSTCGMEGNVMGFIFALLC
ncbi:hypothetical protein MHU86_20563 [Fragilaria crotonensis]|nr:hypothetical protein MHU86_20563 [Fragilaria crotonensis]